MNYKLYIEFALLISFVIIVMTIMLFAIKKNKKVSINLKDMSFSLSQDDYKHTSMLLVRALDIKTKMIDVRSSLKVRQMRKAKEHIAQITEGILNIYIQALLDYTQKNNIALKENVRNSTYCISYDYILEVICKENLYELENRIEMNGLAKLSGNEWNDYIQARLDYYIAVSKKHVEVAYCEKHNLIPFQIWLDNFREVSYKFLKIELTELFEMLRKMAINDDSVYAEYSKELEKLFVM
jgi:hypothetical protein